MNLSKNFKRGEFACKCGCGFDNIDMALVQKIQIARDFYGKPIRISSGCRCPAHNKKVGGVPNSYHQRGLALDVRPFNMPEGEQAIQAEMRMLGVALGIAGFKRYGIPNGRNFYHVDMADDRPAGMFRY